MTTDQLTHYFEGSGGSLSVQRLGDFEAIDQVPGGWMSASGKLPLSLAKANPWLVDGAIWATYLEESLTPIFGGAVMDPAPMGDLAQLTGLGWGHLPEMAVDLFLVESDYVGDFSTVPTDPFTYQGDTRIGTMADAGALKFTIQAGTTFAGGDPHNPPTNNKFVFWAQGQPVNRIAFKISNDLDSFFNTADWRIYIYTATFDPSDGSFSAFTQDGAAIVPANGAVVNRVLTTAPGDIVAVALSRETNLATPVANACSVWLTGIHVDGYAADPGSEAGGNFSATDVVTTISSRLGIAQTQVSSVAASVVPMFIRGGTLADALVQACLLSDTHYGVRGGTTPQMEFGRWGETIWWSVDPRQPVHVTSLPRFDTVTCPFTYASGKLTGLATATAADVTLGVVPAVGRTFPIPLSAALPDQVTAQQFAQVAADYLVTMRYAGDARLASIMDANGILCSAHLIKAGDLIWLPNVPVALRIVQVRHTANGVELTFDSGLAALNKMLALFARNAARKGSVAAGSFAGV